MKLGDLTPAGIAQPEEWKIDRMENDGYVQLSRGNLRITRAADGTWQVAIEDKIGLLVSCWAETPLAAVDDLRKDLDRLNASAAVFVNGEAICQPA